MQRQLFRGICAADMWVYGVYAKALIPMIIGALTSRRHM